MNTSKIPNQNEVDLNRDFVKKILIFGGAFFIVIHIVHLFVFFRTGTHWAVFDLNKEHNPPTLYQAMLWLCSSLLSLWAVKNLKSSARSLWIFFSMIFLFLACDEYFVIHDSLNDPLREKFGLGGAFYFGWVIPYAVALILLLPLAWKFLRSLPIKTQSLFAFSGFIYVFGAFGMELISASHREIHGRDNITFAVATTIEESLEILGVSLFC